MGVLSLPTPTIAPAILTRPRTRCQGFFSFFLPSTGPAGLVSFLPEANSDPRFPKSPSVLCCKCRPITDLQDRLTHLRGRNHRQGSALVVIIVVVVEDLGNIQKSNVSIAIQIGGRIVA